MRSNVEILQAGESLKVEFKANHYVSAPRNKQIAKIVKDLGWIEKYGTGIKRVRQLLLEHRLPEPEFFNVQGGLLVQVHGNALGDDGHNRNFESTKVTDKVTDTQKKILELVETNGYISALQMAEKIGISKHKIMDNLTKLKAAHTLQRVGSAKAGHWEVSI